MRPEEKPLILILDDDDRLRGLLCQFLQGHGFYAIAAASVHEAEKKRETFVFDLIILDIMMPDVDGLSFLKTLRKTCQTPVLLLSAKWETDDKIQGLETGADDYLAKPFDPRELLLRIQSILRRTQLTDEQAMITLGDFTFDIHRALLRKGDTLVLLSVTEQNLLKIFALNAGKTLSREDISSLSSPPLSPRTIDVQITRLRKKIEKNPKVPQYLQTVRNRGYILWGDRT